LWENLAPLNVLTRQLQQNVQLILMATSNFQLMIILEVFYRDKSGSHIWTGYTTRGIYSL